MPDTYLVAPKTLKRLRSGPGGAFIDDFADALERDGYSAASAVRYRHAIPVCTVGPFLLLSVGSVPALHRGKQGGQMLRLPLPYLYRCTPS